MPHQLPHVIEPPSGDFVGRQELLKVFAGVYSNLPKHGEQRRVLEVTGPKGSGKSELIRKAFEREGAKGLVFVVNGSSAETAETSLLLLGKDLGVQLPESDSTLNRAAAVRNVLDLLSREPALAGWTLIYEDVTPTFSSELTRYLPQKGGLAILVSDRHHAIPGADSIVVGQLNPAESAEFLRKRGVVTMVEQLVMKSDNYPFMLELIAGCLQSRSYSPAEFLAIPLTSVVEISAAQTKMVAGVLTDLKATHPASLPLLQQLSYLAGSPVPFPLISGDRSPRPSHTERDVLLALKKVHLVSVNFNSATTSTPNTVAKASRTLLKPSEFPGVITAEPFSCLLGRIVQVTELLKARDATVADIYRRVDYLEHAKTLLYHAEKMGLSHLPEVGRLHFHLASVYASLEDPKDQKQHLEAAIKILKDVKGQEELLGPAYANLGNAEHQLGDTLTALKHHIDAGKIIAKQNGKDHIDFVRHRLNLALVTSDKNQAEKIFREVVAKLTALAEPDLVKALNNLGYHLKLKGNNAGAREAFVKAYLLSIFFHGFAHRLTATAAVNLSLVLEEPDYFEQKGFIYDLLSELRPKESEAVASQPQPQSQSHPQQQSQQLQQKTAKEWEIEGTKCVLQGHLAQAEERYKAAFSLSQGSAVHDRMRLRQWLVEVADSQGKFDEVERYSLEEPNLPLRQSGIGLLLSLTSKAALGHAAIARGDVSRFKGVFDELLGADFASLATVLNNKSSS